MPDDYRLKEVFHLLWGQAVEGGEYDRESRRLWGELQQLLQEKGVDV